MARVLVLIILVLLSGCGKEPLYHSQAYVFGTLVDVSIYGETEERAKTLTDHVLWDFQGLHQRLHAWQPDSEVSKLNAAFADGTQPIPISPELAEIIEHATALSVQSQGLFNPAIGNLIRYWGFQADEFKPIKIDNAVIKKLVATNPQMTDIVIENGRAYSKNPAVRLDLGGYAKGYALDRAAAYLRSQGVKNALINIGGNIIALGKHGKKSWRIGIQHPRKPGAIATLDLEDGWAIGTSGDYQRYFELDGKRYCHIIDPRTGYPAQDKQSVTVLIEPGLLTGILSDALSKPIFISSHNASATTASAIDVSYFMIVDAKGQRHASPKMLKKIVWLEN